jgi:hypothetical protein
LSSCSVEDAFGVVLFHSVHGALRAEKILISAGVRHKLIPVPRHLSSDCGFCLRFVWSDKNLVERLLDVDLGIETIQSL